MDGWMVLGFFCFITSQLKKVERNSPSLTPPPSVGRENLFTSSMVRPVLILADEPWPKTQDTPVQRAKRGKIKIDPSARRRRRHRRPRKRKERENRSDEWIKEFRSFSTPPTSK
jgi:hypothetical protein